MKRKNKKKTYNKDTYSTYNTYNSYSYYTKPLPEHPKLENMDKLVDISEKDGTRYVVSELVKGVSFCATYDLDSEFELNFHKEEENKDNETDFMSLEAIINAKDLPLYIPFKRLIDKLGAGKVPFTVFLEYVTYENQRSNYIEKGDDTAKVIIYDIYINKNWISYDLLEDICSECGLYTPPIIYEGAYDKKIIENFIYKVPSIYNEAEKYGVVIKSFIEDSKRYKRLAKIELNKNLVPEKEQKKTEVFLTDNEVDRKIKAEIKDRFFEARRMSLDKKIKTVYPELKSAKIAKVKGKLLSYAVQSAIKEFFSYWLNDVKKKNSEGDYKKIKKQLNKELSSIFIKRYDLFKGVEK